eukprot:jgi/Psemu1/11647/gm1.11647_g
MDDGQIVYGFGIIFGGIDQQKWMTDRPLNHFLVVTPYVLVNNANSRPQMNNTAKCHLLCVSQEYKESCTVAVVIAVDVNADADVNADDDDDNDDANVDDADADA